MKFNLEDYTSADTHKICMRCTSASQAKEFCDFLHANGRRWQSGQFYNKQTNWCPSKKCIIYYFNEGTYSYLANKTDVVLNWSDFMLDTVQFCLSDIKKGDVIKCRNGIVALFAAPANYDHAERLFVYSDGSCLLYSSYNENLTHKFNSDFDIMQVIRNNDCNVMEFNFVNPDMCELVYQRSKRKLTVEQISCLLGEDIEVIS